MNPKTGIRLSASSLRSRLQSEPGTQIIDVRSAAEYNAGHIPQAINLPLEQLEQRLDDIRDGAVLVCKSGTRAGLACDQIASLRSVAVLEGGTEAWISEHLPVVRTTQTRWSLDRQVRLGAGVMVLIGVSLGFLVHPGWFGLAGFVGAGLTFAGLTDICGMASLLAMMPWNRPASVSTVTEGSRS